MIKALAKLLKIINEGVLNDLFYVSVLTLKTDYSLILDHVEILG